MIVRGRLLLPEAGAAWVEDGAVLVDGDEIAAIGTFAELSAARPDAEVVGSERHVVIPGLVNAHYHGEGLSTVQRGHLEDRAAVAHHAQVAQRDERRARRRRHTQRLGFGLGAHSGWPRCWIQVSVRLTA